MKARVLAAFLIAAPYLVASELTYASDLDVAINLDPVTNTLDPQQDRSKIGTSIFPNIFDTLITLSYDDKGVSELKPALATSWKKIDNRTFELELRKGVTFHDGSNFSSKDVAFTFDHARILSDSWPGAAAMKSYFSDLTVKAIDEDTVQFITDKPDPLLLYRLTHSTASIISRQGFQKAANIEAWSRKPIGTGPYEVVEYRPKEFIKLAANSNYWNGKVQADHVKLWIVPELAARISGLAAGDYDLITQLPPDQLAVIDGYSELETIGGAVNNIEFIVFDTSNEILKDPLLREALSLGIDRKLIVKGLFNDRTIVPPGYQLPAFADLYDKNRKPPAFDQNKAIELVKKSSYAGQIIPFRIRNNYYTNEIARAEVIAQMWKQIGVNVKIQVVESSAETFGGIRNASNSMAYPDPAGMQLRIWREGGYYDKNQTLASVDRKAFFAPAYKLATVLNDAERKAATSDWLDQWDSQRPGTILHQSTIFYGKSKSVKWRAAPDLVLGFGPDRLSW